MKKDDVQFYPQKQPYFTNTYTKIIKKPIQLQQNQDNHQSKASIKDLQIKIHYLEEQLTKLSQLLCEDINNSNIVLKLTKQMTQMKKNNLKLQEQLNKSNKDNKQLKIALEEMGDQMKVIGLEIQLAKDQKIRIEQLIIKNRQLQQIKQSLNKQLYSIHQSYAEKQKQMLKKQKQLQHQISKYQSQIRKIKQQNTLLSSQIINYTQINKQNQLEIDRIIQKKIHQEKQVIQEFQISKDTYNQGIKELHNIINQQRQNNLKIIEQNQHFKRQNKQLNLTLIQVNNQLHDSQKQNQKKYLEIQTQIKFNKQYAQEINKLHLQNAKLNQKINELSSKLQQQQNYSAQLKEIIKSQNNKADTQNQNCKLNLRIAKQQLTQTLNRLNQQLARFQELKSKWKKKEQSINQQLASSTNKIHKYQLEIMNQNITIQNQKQSILMYEKLLQDQKNKNIQQIAQFEEQYMNIKNAMDSQAINIQKIKEQNIHILKLKQEYDSKLNQYNNIIIPNTQKQIITLKDMIKKQQSTVAKIQQQNENLKRQNRNIVIRLNQQNKHREQLDNHIKLTQIKFRQLAYNNQVLNLKQSKMVINNQAELHFYQIQNSSLKSHLKSLQNQISQLRKEHHSLNKKSQDLQTQYIKNNQRQSNLNAIIRQLQIDKKNKSDKLYEFQNQLIAQKRNMDQLKYQIQKQKNTLLDQIQKLKIQNSYHRNHFHKLMQTAQYKPNPINQHQYFRFQNRYKSLQTLTQKQMHSRHSTSNKQQAQQYIIQLKEQNHILAKRLQRANKDIGKLKDCIEDKLQSNGISSREESCAVQQAIWLIQVLNTQIIQYKKDMNTIRQQKKEQANKNTQLEAKLNKLQFQKNHLISQIQVMLQRIKQLQEYQMSSQSRITRNKIPNNNYLQSFKYGSRELQRSESESNIKKNYSKITQQSMDIKNQQSKEREMKRLIFGTMRKQIIGMIEPSNQY